MSDNIYAMHQKWLQKDFAKKKCTECQLQGSNAVQQAKSAHEFAEEFSENIWISILQGIWTGKLFNCNHSEQTCKMFLWFAFENSLFALETKLGHPFESSTSVLVRKTTNCLKKMCVHEACDWSWSWFCTFHACCNRKIGWHHHTDVLDPTTRQWCDDNLIMCPFKPTWQGVALEKGVWFVC